MEGRKPADHRPQLFDPLGQLPPRLAQLVAATVVPPQLGEPDTEIEPVAARRQFLQRTIEDPIDQRLALGLLRLEGLVEQPSPDLAFRAQHPVEAAMFEGHGGLRGDGRQELDLLVREGVFVAADHGQRTEGAPPQAQREVDGGTGARRRRSSAARVAGSAAVPPNAASGVVVDAPRAADRAGERIGTERHGLVRHQRRVIDGRPRRSAWPLGDPCRSSSPHRGSPGDRRPERHRRRGAAGARRGPPGSLLAAAASASPISFSASRRWVRRRNCS